MNIFTFIFMFLAVIFAGLAQSIKRRIFSENDGEITEKYVFNTPYFLISYLILAVICFISASGADTGLYAAKFETWTLSDLWDISIEPGYKLLNLFLHIFIKEGYVGIGVIKLINIGLVYRSIYLLRDRVSTGIAVLAYVSLLYICNFQLLRMMLAVGFVFLGLSYEIIGKSKRAFVLICISILFHYTAISLLLTYVTYIFLRKKISTAKIMAVSVSLALVSLLGSAIINVLVYNISFFRKYTVYLSKETSPIGMGQIVFFIPVLYLLFCAYKHEKDDAAYCLSFLLGLMTFMIAVLGYSFPVLGRASYYFYFFFVYFPAYIVRKDYAVVWLKFGNHTKSLEEYIVVAYLIFRMILSHTSEILMHSGLDEITYIWNVM